MFDLVTHLEVRSREHTVHSKYEFELSSVTWFPLDNACSRYVAPKDKTATKLHSTKINFWKHSTTISRGDKIRNTIIKQKMNMYYFAL